MNKIYRVVWNAETGQWVVASEMAKGRKKKGTAGASVVAVATFAVLAAPSAFASFTGGGGTVGTGNNDGIAIGSGAVATNGYAIGTGAKTTGSWSIGIGENVTTNGVNALAIGGKAKALADDGIAIGSNAYTNYSDTVTIGSDSKTTGADAVALGAASQALSTNTIAIGKSALAQDGSSTAIGGNSVAKGSWSIALGASAKTALDNSVAVGGNSSAAGVSTVAVGANTVADASDSVAVGNTASVATSATSGTALGKGSNVAANAINAVALGANSMADRANSVSVGKSGAERQITNLAKGTASTDAVNVNQLQGVIGMVGAGAQLNSDGTVKAPTFALTNANTIGGTTGAATDVGAGFTKVDAALGTLNTNINNIKNGAGIKYFHVNSTGTDSSATGGEATAIGPGAVASDYSDIAIGLNAAASGDYSTAIGSGAKSDGASGVSVGVGAHSGSVAIAIGSSAQASDGAVAVGSGSSATLSNAVALGRSSVADRASGAGGSTKAAVSVGSGGAGVATDTRQIISVARGTQDTDAVNVSQLKGVTTALGGSAAVNADGTIKAPSYALTNANTIGGTTGAATDVGAGFTKVDAALGKLDTATTKNAGDITTLNTTVNNITNGGGIKYFHTKSTLADSAATGADSVAAGPLATSKGTNSVAIGNAANANDGSTIAVGGLSEAKGSWSVALGTSAKTTSANSVALGSNSSVTVANAVALGDSSVADRANSVSVGKSGAERQIMNMAKGTADTDAVNVSQLKGIASALGGGTAVNADGSIKAPSYDVNGTAYTNVGGAVDALDSRIDTVAANPLTFAGNSSSVTRKLGDTLKIQGLATTAGTFSGGNIKTVADSATGAINIQMADAPKFGNVTINDGGKISGLTAGTADGDAVTKKQLDDAVIGAGAGWKIKANTGTAGTIKGGDTLNVVDGTNTKVAFDSSKNELKVSVADAPTFSGMVTANGGLTVGAGKTVDMGGNKITKVAAGTAATDAVNFGQLKGSEQSVADAIGGGSTVNADGTITKPTYSVDGKDATGIDGAITALDNSVKAAKDGIDGLDGKITDLGDKGLTFSDTAGTKVQRKLGETLAIKGLGTTSGTFSGGNIKTVADATTGAINIQMADAPKFGDITINDGGKISGLTAGTADGDAVTKKQLDDAVIGAGAGWKIKANTGTAGTIKGGDTLNVVDGTNTKVAFDSSKNELKVSVADAPTFSGMVTANGGLTVGAGKTVDMGGNKITKVAAGTADTDAVNFSQLKASAQSVADAIGGGSTVDAETGKISEPSYSVDGKDATGIDGAITALDNSVKAAKDGIDGLNADMADAVKYDSDAHDKVTFGTDGTPVTLANVANGSVAKDSKEAVNGGQLYDLQTKAAADIAALGDKGMSFGGNSGTVKRKLGETLAIKGAGTTSGTFSGGNIKTVADATTGAINIQMADAPKFGDITINDGGKISGLTAGTADGDAVTKKQLDDAVIGAGAGWKIKANTGTAGTIKGGDTLNVVDGTNTKVAFDSTKNELKVSVVDSPKFGDITINDGGKITGLENGTAAGDAATAGQLQELADVIGGGTKVDPTTGEITAPKFDVTDKDGKPTEAKTVADAVSTLDDHINDVDDRTTSNTEVINNIINNGTGIKYFHANSTLADSQAKGIDSVAIGGNAIASGKYSVAIGANSKADRDNTVSVGSAGAERQIVNVAAGTQLTDAVNVSQLKTVADATTAAIGGGMSIDPATGAVTQPTFNVTDKDGNPVEAHTVAEAVSTIDTHVNKVEENVTNIDGRVTTIEGDVTNIINGTTGLVQQDKDSRELTVGKDTDGTVVNFTNKDGEARVLDGVAKGEIAEGSTQAINGGQAYDIANSVAEVIGGGATVKDGTISLPERTMGDGSKAATISDAIGNLDDRTTENTTNITNLDQRTTQNTTNISNLTQQITNGSVGLVQYDDASGTVTVAAGKGGKIVDFANVDGQSRQLKHVAAGTEDEDAVNVSQLQAALGGSTTDDNGNYVGPSYTIVNQAGDEVTVHNVGDAFTTIDSRVTNLYQQVNEGTVGLVQQASAGEKLTVGKDTDGAEVDFANVNGEARKLSNVADGQVTAESKDAVNGSQLHTVAQSVADAMGGGSTVDKDGSITAPTYNVTNVDGTTNTVTGIEGAVNNLDQRTYSNTTQIQNITNQINSNGIGMVQQAAPGEDITVAKGTDGKAVNFTGTAGDRVLTGVAAGSADNDAVNVKQLKDAGVIDNSGNAKSVVTYDNAEKTSITMGGEGASTPVAVHNVADGVADHDAVNVSQLNQRLSTNNTEVLTQANSYTDQRVNDVWQNLGDAINQVNQQANRGIAAASALVNVTPYLPGHTAVNAGVASYRGEAALGVGVSRWSDNGRVNFDAGVSAAKGDQPVFRVGVGYVF